MGELRKTVQIPDAEKVKASLRAFGLFVRTHVLFFGAIGLFLCSIIVALTFSAPRHFPTQEDIVIPEGYTLVETVRLLDEAHVVRSAFVLQLVMMTLYTDDGVQAGTYLFPRPLSVFEVARSVAHGEYTVPPVRVTFPEGLTAEQIAKRVADQTTIIESAFLDAAEGKEGYLFPETYHIPESYTASELVSLMEETFFERIEPLHDDIAELDASLEDVVIMASIIEREANTEESRKLISGILWERIDIGMPLQVDATFVYLLGKTSAELTRDDLAIDSPYNTYKNRGLPPTPIANPGFSSLEAAVRPESSPYLFYLTGADGAFYYAETFEEHVENKRLHL